MLNLSLTIRENDEITLVIGGWKIVIICAIKEKLSGTHTQ